MIERASARDFLKGPPHVNENDKIGERYDKCPFGKKLNRMNRM